MRPLIARHICSFTNTAKAMDYKTGRQSAHLHMSDEEFNRRFGAVASGLGIEWLKAAGDHPIQVLWQRKDGFAVNQLCLLGDAIAGFNEIDSKWTNDHIGKIKGVDANARRGSMFELLGANLFRHPPQSVSPTKRNYPGYDLRVIFPDGAAADISLKSYGTSAHEKTFRMQAVATERTLLNLLSRGNSSGSVLMAIAQDYPSTGDWETLQSGLATLSVGQPVQRGMWAVKLAALPADYQPYSPRHRSYQLFITAPFHRNESKNLSDKFDDAFANAKEHAAEKKDSVRIVLVHVPEAMSLRTCDRWAKDYLANNPGSPIDGIYLYQLTVVEQPNDQSLMSHALCISETARFSQWRSRPGKAPRVFALNLAIGMGTEPTHIETRGGLRPLNLEERYNYQKGEFYTLHQINRCKPTTAWIRNLASGIFQFAVLQGDHGESTLGGHFPPNKDVTLFD
jgi:hypothetical protein